MGNCHTNSTVKELAEQEESRSRASRSIDRGESHSEENTHVVEAENRRYGSEHDLGILVISLSLYL